MAVPTERDSSPPDMPKFSLDHPIDPDLFGPCAVTPAPSPQLAGYVHPRINFNKEQWESLLTAYANNFGNPFSWSAHQNSVTHIRGPESPFIIQIAELDPAVTELYTGDTIDLSGMSQADLSVLKPLADVMADMNELNSHSFFMCAFWAGVNERMPPGEEFMSRSVTQRCKNAVVNWSKVLLAHRAYTCASTCPRGKANEYAKYWDYKSTYTVYHEWSTGGYSLALTYDTMYESFTNEEKKLIRSALAMVVLKKASWGNTEESTASSPNGALHPHRIFSNWAPYHSTLYGTNLAIEGESGFDMYTSAVLSAEGETGFNTGLNYRFTKMMEAYMTHSIYPDGSTFEDGYTYFIAMREGSLGLIALTRRGINLLDTPRFRNFIHNLVQMIEPWQCGSLIGHGAGGGSAYPTYVALFKYAYPNGILPAVIFRNRLGDIFEKTENCRIDWHQHMMPMTILSSEHDESITTASIPQQIDPTLLQKIPNSFHTTRRGLVIMRNDWRSTSTYVHFDARPDSFVAGHDNADRGVFTFSAREQTWLTDLPRWRENVDSRKHSLLHVDGLAQDEKVPSVSIVQATDNGDMSSASADLTYGYNVQWARGGNGASPPRRHVVSYESGVEKHVTVLFEEKEVGNPKTIAWPEGDDGADIGLARPSCDLWGDANLGFSGLYTWKRAYRKIALEWVVRSVSVVRSDLGDGYALVVDSVSAGDEELHAFESYLVLNDDVDVDEEASVCGGGVCTIVLTNGHGTEATILALTEGMTAMTYRVEEFTTEAVHERLVLKTKAVGGVSFWLGLHAREEETDFDMTTVADGNIVQVGYGTDTKFFQIDRSTHRLTKTTPPVEKNAPMEYQILDRRRKKFRRADFQNDTQEFVDDTEAPLQAVVQIRSSTHLKKRRWRENWQVFTTCVGKWKPRTVSSLALYDCGDDDSSADNYKDRKCERVAVDEEIPCVRDGVVASKALWFRQSSMKPSHLYYVVLSAWPEDSSKKYIAQLMYASKRRSLSVG